MYGVHLTNRISSKFVSHIIVLAVGFLVGIIENLAGTYIPVIGGELKLPIALFLIVAVLLIKPAGLLGRRTVQRV